MEKHSIRFNKKQWGFIQARAGDEFGGNESEYVRQLVDRAYDEFHGAKAIWKTELENQISVMRAQMDELLKMREELEVKD